MLDMYDFEGDIWLCHSFRGQCFNFTAFVIHLSILTVYRKLKCVNIFVKYFIMCPILVILSNPQLTL